jgi:hypothetical protein
LRPVPRCKEGGRASLCVKRQQHQHRPTAEAAGLPQRHQLTFKVGRGLKGLHWMACRITTMSPPKNCLGTSRGI